VSVRRTTLAAEADDLALLQQEARRRGLSLAQLLRELVAREADELRTARKPRFGIARTSAGAAKTAAGAEDEPVRSRAGS